MVEELGKINDVYNITFNETQAFRHKTHICVSDIVITVSLNE